MNTVALIKYLLPPACVDLARAALGSRLLGGTREWEYLPGGWEEHDGRVAGWNVASVAQTQRSKWDEFRRAVQGTGPLGVAHEAARPSAEDYAAHNTVACFGYVLALAARGKDRLSLLDWGGGLGHYAVLARALLPDTALDYHCKDLPLLCRAGREVLPDATFHEDDGAALARRYDLVLASSSLQYSRDWRGTLAGLAAAAAGYLYVTRLPVVRRAPSFVVVQRPHRYGYHTEYLGWFLNREELLGHARGLGVELVREFLIQERPAVPGAPEQPEYRGFLFRARPGGG
jgi:putative methyltransferase (TIGR04325 family)